MPPKARNCQEDFFPPLLSDIAAKIRVMKGGRDRNDDDDIDKKKLADRGGKFRRVIKAP